MISYPPVVQAVMDEDMDKLKQLIAEGTPIDEVDNEGYTALQYAAMWGDLEATKWLIENGADVNTTDPWGSTPLMNAVYNGAGVETVELLLENGANKYLKRLRRKDSL